MDLRTKLVFALVLTSLGSMSALGWATFRSAETLMRTTSLDNLAALAQTRSEAVEELISGWEEHVALIASRTQLRRSTAAFRGSGDPADAERVRAILADALGAVEAVRSIVVRDPLGSVIAEVGRPEPDFAPTSPALPPGVSYLGIAFGEGPAPLVAFRSPLVLEGETIATLDAVLVGRELRELIEAVDGLGQSGRTLLTARALDGVPHLLRPARSGPSGPLEELGPNPTGVDPVRLALEGGEGRWDDVVDRRGRRVWASSRHLPEVGWGLTVAFDEDEELAPLRVFRSDLTDLALSLSAIAILVGTLLGLRFAKPLHDLTGVADRIRGGDLAARAPVGREDEIGLLARTFNEMTDELEGQMVLLRDFRKFFDVSLDMMCIAGTDGYFKRINPAFTRILGWTRDQLLDRPFFEFVHPDDVEATEREVGKLAEGVPTVSFQNRYRCADGSYRVLRWASYPDPDIGRIYAIARDVTDHVTG